MSDPLTIIGLAASVIQIVDVTGRLITKSYEISKSAAGAFHENLDLELIVVDLQQTNARVAKIPLQFGDDDKLDQDDRAIRQLCVGCNEVADELLSRLSLLKISRNNGDPRALESLKYAWKFIRSKKDLDALAARVAGYREQLQTRILVSLTARLDNSQLEQSCRFDVLERTGRDILDSVRNNRNMISTDIANQTDYLTRLANKHHEEVIQRLSVIARGPILSRSPLPGYKSVETIESAQDVGLQQLTIHEIVEKGDFTSLQERLRAKPDAIFDINSLGETPLHIAARRGDLKMILYLLRRGANKNADNSKDQTPLHLAVEANNTETVRLLIVKGADSDTEDENGKTPLDYVPEDCEISWILRVGPGIEDKDQRGFTALREFVTRGNIDVVKSLLDRGANVNARSEELASTPLLEAAYKSDLDMMELLLTRGAEVDARDGRNGTVLVVAAWHGLTAAMEKLLDHGADINACNNIGFTALHETCFAGHVHEETALMLMSRGAYVEVRTGNGDGYTPLAMACQVGSEVIVRRLLELGADVNNPGCGRWTALHEACEHGHPALVKLLLQHGAKSDVLDDQGYAPLTRAASQGYSDCVQILLEIGKADVNAPWSKLKPLEAAFAHGYYGIVSLLVQNGAVVESVDITKYIAASQDKDILVIR